MWNRFGLVLLIFIGLSEDLCSAWPSWDFVLKQVKSPIASSSNQHQTYYKVVPLTIGGQTHYFRIVDSPKAGLVPIGRPLSSPQKSATPAFGLSTPNGQYQIDQRTRNYMQQLDYNHQRDKSNQSPSKSSYFRPSLPDYGFQPIMKPSSGFDDVFESTTATPPFSTIRNHVKLLKERQKHLFGKNENDFTGNGITTPATNDGDEISYFQQREKEIGNQNFGTYPKVPTPEKTEQAIDVYPNEAFTYEQKYGDPVKYRAYHPTFQLQHQYRLLNQEPLYQIPNIVPQYVPVYMDINSQKPYNPFHYGDDGVFRDFPKYTTVSTESIHPHTHTQHIHHLEAVVKTDPPKSLPVTTLAVSEEKTTEPVTRVLEKVQKTTAKPAQDDEESGEESETEGENPEQDDDEPESVDGEEGDDEESEEYEEPPPPRTQKPQRSQKPRKSYQKETTPPYMSYVSREVNDSFEEDPYEMAYNRYRLMEPDIDHSVEDDESDEETDETRHYEHYTPTRRYTQVRKSITRTHKPRLKDDPRLKERLTKAKTQVVYKEEGYEDREYDHGGAEKHTVVTEGTRIRRNVLVKNVTRTSNRSRNNSRRLPAAAASTTSSKASSRNRSTEERKKKYPWNDLPPEALHELSPLRYAEHTENPYKGKSVYVEKETIDCKEDEVDLDDAGFDGSKKKRLGQLGRKVSCLKEKHFGKDPLDNPLFKEVQVTAATHSPGWKDVKTKKHKRRINKTVYEDVMNNIKHSQKKTSNSASSSTKTQPAVKEKSKRKRKKNQKVKSTSSKPPPAKLRSTSTTTTTSTTTSTTKRPDSDTDSDSNSDEKHPPLVAQSLFDFTLNFDPKDFPKKPPARPYDHHPRPALITAENQLPISKWNQYVEQIPPATLPPVSPQKIQLAHPILDIRPPLKHPTHLFAASSSHLPQTTAEPPLYRFFVKI